MQVDFDLTSAFFDEDKNLVVRIGDEETCYEASLPPPYDGIMNMVEILIDRATKSAKIRLLFSVHSLLKDCHGFRP